MTCIQGNNLNNTLHGTDSNDCINAQEGNDRLYGHEGNDILRGHAGNDFLRGDGGNDTLVGGGGADRFFFRDIQSVTYLNNNRYRVISDDGVDIIHDLNESLGDRILNRVNNKTSIYDIGNLEGTPGSGTPPGGDGTSILDNDFYFDQLNTLDSGIMSTPFSSASAIELGVTNWAAYRLTNINTPKLPYEIKNSQGYSGHRSVTFSITPSSRYGFEKESVIAFTNASVFVSESVGINKNVVGSPKQVVLVYRDIDAPEETLHEGTDKAEQLNGTSRDDIMDAKEGNDVVRGLEGSDIILAGSGMDTIIGGTGNDSLYGNSDADDIRGQEGEDIINGGSGNDLIYGGADDDVLFGWTGQDTINGNAGNDFLDGEWDDDVLIGGLGDDTFQGGDGDDLIIGGAGIDRLIEKGIGFTLTNNRLIGMGTDTLNGIENVHLIGLETHDRISAANFTLGQVTLEGGSGIDTLIGSSDNDLLIGGEDRDILQGRNGDDELNGDLGNDGLIGGNGHDTLVGGMGSDVLRGDDGSDILNGTTSNGTNRGLLEVDTLVGGNGFDIFILGESNRNFYDNSSTTDNSGSLDYALINDFQASQDSIRLKGSETYILENITLGGISGTGIYESKGTVLDLNGNFILQKELIGLVRGINANSLTVNIGNQFSVIGQPLL